MEESQKTYSIGSVAERTKLTTHTIRVWEKRYQAIVPTRSGGGTRRYSEADIRRLSILNAAVQAGNRIGDIVHLDDDSVMRMAQGRAETNKRTRRQTSTGRSTIDESTLTRIVESAQQLDSEAIEREFTIHFNLLGGEDFKATIAAPLLAQIGVLWERGEFSIASEHLVSATLRPFLLRSFESAARDQSGPRIIFATAEQELHDLGLLMVAGTAAQLGAQVINLGAQLPVASVADAATRLDADAVALSMVHLGRGVQRAYVSQLREQLPPTTEIWLGGHQAVEGIDGCHVLDLEKMAIAIERLKTLVQVDCHHLGHQRSCTSDASRLSYPRFALFDRSTL